MDRQRIEELFEAHTSLTPDKIREQAGKDIEATIEALDRGEIRIAEKKAEGGWMIHQWAKKAVLLYFKITPNEVVPGAHTHYFDKVPSKYSAHRDHQQWDEAPRVVPGACVRKGAYVAKNAILMPSFVNIGAYVDEGTMIDTWATVGCCAQIGKNVHLSGGAGIGGVLEPPQASPTIVEDNCFIGARSEIAEGVIVETGAVISMGVYIGQSTPIYNRQTGETIYGRIPPYSVVIPGTRPSQDGTHSTYCAIIVKQVDEKTRAKTALNELLREAADADG